MSNKKEKNSSVKNAEGLKFSKLQLFALGFLFILTLALIAVNFIFGEEKFAVSMPLVVLDIFLAIIVILPSIKHFSITKGDFSVVTSVPDKMSNEEIELDEKETETLQGTNLTKEKIQEIKEELVNKEYLDNNAFSNQKITSNKISNRSATFNFYSKEKNTFVKIITAKNFTAQLHDSLFFRISRFLEFKDAVPDAKMIVALVREDNEGDSLKNEIESAFHLSENDNGVSCVLLELRGI